MGRRKTHSPRAKNLFKFRPFSYPYTGSLGCMVRMLKAVAENREPYSAVNFPKALRSPAPIETDYDEHIRKVIS